MREATVQIIKNVEAIENADMLEQATVLGWKVVVKKGEFKIGDKCVFVELDSLLPEKPEFEFLRNKKFRIKTVRLRGALSQGIIFPLSILPSKEYDLYEESEDVSEIIGVTHYEKPIPVNLRGQVKGNFPPYIPKTDEPRIQNYPNILDEFMGVDCYISVKCDGTSATFSMKDGDFNVCSRNLAYKETDEIIYWKIAKKYNIEKILSLYKNYAIQGEICGPGIQKNRLGLKDYELLVFDLWDIDNQEYLDFEEMMFFCRLNGLKTVPIEEVIAFNFTFDKLLEKAKGKYEGTSNRREGIVIRPLMGRYSRTLKRRLSIKALNNEYLEKDEE